MTKYVLSAIDHDDVVGTNIKLDAYGHTMCDAFKRDPYPFQTVLESSDINELLLLMVESMNNGSCESEYVRLCIIDTNADGLATSMETLGVTNEELRSLSF